MIGEKRLSRIDTARRAERSIGTLGHLGILAWSFIMILISPTHLAPLTPGLCACVVLWLYPTAFRRLLHWRWLILLGSLVMVNTLWVGDPELRLWGFIPVSIAGLESGLLMAVRAVVILLVVDGFSDAVDISEVAGLLERIGLRGLGFSLGIAFNLLPSLRQSSANTWRSLWMRGGLRRERWQGLKLFFVTVAANALRRAEGIALAAESRAFTPENARALQLKGGKYDLSILVMVGITIIGLIFIL